MPSEPSLAGEVARLYALAPDEFVAARNAAAKSSKQAGRKDDAAALAALRKPSVIQHALNQAAHRDPATARRGPTRPSGPTKPSPPPSVVPTRPRCGRRWPTCGPRARPWWTRRWRRAATSPGGTGSPRCSASCPSGRCPKWWPGCSARPWSPRRTSSPARRRRRPAPGPPAPRPPRHRAPRPGGPGPRRPQSDRTPRWPRRRGAPPPPSARERKLVTKLERERRALAALDAEHAAARHAAVAAQRELVTVEARRTTARAALEATEAELAAEVATRSASG